MKLTQEKFDKLPQLDRIEYRQVQNSLIEDTKINNFSYAVHFSLIIIFIILIVSLLIKSAFGGDDWIKIFNLIKPLALSLFLLILLGFLLDIDNAFKRKRGLEFLQNKFLQNK